MFKQAVASCVFLLFATLVVTSAACETPDVKKNKLRSSEFNLSTERVVVFKDGYCMVIKKGMAKTDGEGRAFSEEVPEAAVLEAVGRAYQAAGALHAVSYAPCAPDAGEWWAVERLAGDPREIRYRAACSLEDHAIKLAEAALREDALAPDRALRLAAADAALHMGGSQRSC